MNRLLIVFLLPLALTGLTFLPVKAQTEEPTPPPNNNPEADIPLIHQVEEGENLTFIAERYGVSVQELLLINNLTEESILYVGQPLIIPGGEGESVAATYTVQVGDTLAGIAANFNTSVAQIAQTNRLIHPGYELAVGQTLSLISRTGSAQPQAVTGTPHIVAPGDSLLTLAARYNTTPAALAAANDLPFPTYLFPGQRLRIPGERPYYFLPGEWIEIQVRPLPIVAGSTLSIYVANVLDGLPSGRFGDQTLHFTRHGDGFIAMLGLDAFTQPGSYKLELGGSGSRPWQPFSQSLPVTAGNYSTQHIPVTEELAGLLDPQLRQDEDAFLETIYTRFTEPQQWSGLFQYPVTTTVVTAGYGDGRSYNGGPVEIFHTGVDFAGAVGTPILAPANGTVVFNGTLELRGNSVIIDHGLGVMTAYFHLSESFVEVGDVVTTGQPIAAGGSTGLSTGPHLHWDLRIMNVAVNPLQWTKDPFP